MRNGNPCPKCQISDALYVPGGLLQGQDQAVVGAFLPTRFRIARYVCLNCGYTEEWVDREDDMQVARSLRGKI